MRFLLPFLLILLAAGAAAAQTHAIAYKSHGGSEAELRDFIAVTEEADFGLTPEMERRMEERRTMLMRVDSVIRITDSTVLTVRSQYARKEQQAGRRLNTTRDTLRITAPGPRGALDNARRNVQAWYGVEADSARFVGFDKTDSTLKKEQGSFKKEHSHLPVVPVSSNNDPGPPAGLPLLLAGIALLASLLTGGITWLYRRMPGVS